MKKFKCKVCGAVAQLENLPENYRCSVCGSSEDVFYEFKEEIIKKYIPISPSNPAIQRLIEKCINCGGCTTTCIDKVGIKYDVNKVKEPVCVNCGQCRITCPTGAIQEKYEYKQVKEIIKDKNKKVVCITSPAVRVSLGEEFDMKSGTNIEGKMVSSLRKLGFSYVFDTTFGADLTTMEEANELVYRLESKKNLPLFSSCCPAWVKYISMYHPNLLNHLSSCKSPIGMISAVIKNYFADKINVDKKDIIVVALTPCTAKKYEREYDENVDYVITTSEMGMYLREEKVDFNKLKASKFDNVMSRGSAGGVIFGSSGGVTESVLRVVYNILTKKDPKKQLTNFKAIRGLKNFKEANIKINDKNINVAVIYGLEEVEKVLQKLENNEEVKYDFIEVMNCPGGCVGGGGQPLKTISKMQDINLKRMQGLYKEDKSMKIKSSYKNPDIIEVYKKYLGCPLSNKSKELLHTKHKDKSDLLL